MTHALNNLENEEFDIFDYFAKHTVLNTNKQDKTCRQIKNINLFTNTL